MKPLFLCLISSFLCHASLAAQTTPAPATRSVQDLSGVWDVRLDPADAGEAQGWLKVKGHPAGWQPLAVPGSPNVQLTADPMHPVASDTNLFYKGAMWFHTTFSVTEDKRLLSELHLASVVLRNKVWVNGQLAGSSAVPYQDVAYDVTGLLKPGSNDVVIEVDNRPLQRGIPDAKWRGWWDNGGLIGAVTLVRHPLTHAATYATTTMLPGGRWKLQLDTAVHQVPGITPARLKYSLLDNQGNTVWETERSVSSRENALRLAVTAELSGVHDWTPDHPTLYRLLITTSANDSVDPQSFRVGFRQIEARGSEVLLNGVPVKLRGINRHQVLAGKGMTLTAAENRADMADIKSLGANFTRLAHYSQAQDVYDACDELGLLVWTEVPAWQTAAATLADPAVWEKDAVPQLRAMVEQHRNHPSVIIYSVANEIPTDKPEGAAYVGKAIQLVHSLDPSRLATFASDKRENDLALGYVDIVAVNEYFGWYYGTLSDVGPMLDTMHAKYPAKPILVSEFGSEAIAGWDPATARPDNKGVTKNFSYDYQKQFLEQHLGQIYAPQRASYVAGGAIWVYNDFPDPHRIGGDQPAAGQYRNCKGLTTMDRQKKPAYTTVHDFFARLAAAPAGSPHVADGQ